MKEEKEKGKEMNEGEEEEVDKKMRILIREKEGKKEARELRTITSE
eukprot:CAMPEP_0173144448 /NCGR_PEP_ID=MMETSP1105-20130129/7234_1 /TAXON_ID=2985 /ORGANISM="Ochromonas sp., Strain BG-1" /LENGTH=45 /DNA_ID= /DNA_START= /DNA_END= /DNA_ORIENTATION=